MMSNRAFSIKPILGNTSSSYLSVFARLSKSKGMLAIFKIFDSNGVELSEQRISTSKRLDNVVFCKFGGLEANTTYSIKCSVFKINSDEGVNWNDAFELNVSTFPTAANNTSTKFALTSCRHPGIAGFFRDQMLNKLFQNLDDSPLDFRIACGDQVYADHPKGSFIPKLTPNSRSSFFTKYRINYNRAFQKIARVLPTFCIFDDHEVLNDWSLGKFLEQKPLYRFHHKTGQKIKMNGLFSQKTLSDALFTYDTYQGLLSGQVGSLEELSMRKDRNYLTERPDYSYDFKHGSCGFFCMDTRYERIEGNEFDPDRSPEFQQMLSENQISKLIDFLNDGSYLVKFIVSAVPLFPDTKALFGAPWDKWKGGAATRREILEHIDNNAIKNVFVLSGDVHCSFTSKLTLPNGGVVHNIVSSALNWPIPGLTRKNLDIGPLFKFDEATTELLSSQEGESVTANNNYTTVEYSEQNLTIKVFDKNGLTQNHTLRIDV